MQRKVMGRHHEVEVVVGSAVDPTKTPFQEKVEEESRQGFFNMLTVLGFAMTAIQFLDSKWNKK